MDYFGILKRAWTITWRYKALWVLGFFAASSSGGNSGGGNSGGGSGGSNGASSGVGDSFGQFEQWASSNIAVIAIVAGVLVVVIVAFFILSVAAQGGLVWGANEGAEDRKPSLRKAWGIGFSKWGRVFMLSFVLGLPILALLGVVLVILLIGIGGAAAAGDSAAAGGVAALGGMCCFAPLIFLVVIVASVVLGIIYQLALRYAVLQDVTFGQAIMRGWEDLRGKRGAFVFWLVMLLPGFAFGFAVLILILPFVFITLPFFASENYVIATAVLALLMLVLVVPYSIFGTFSSTAWTVFFRRMNGLETPDTQTYPTRGVIEPQAPYGYVPPTAPMAPAPPTAPMSSAPTAPPAPPTPPAPIVPATFPAPEAAPSEQVPDDFWVAAPPEPPVPPADE